MGLRDVIAVVHFLALGLGLGSCLARGYSLRNLKDTAGLKTVFFCDNLYGIAALLWIGSGILRAFGGLEKGTAYYLANHVFWLKMTLFLFVFLLEIKPMVTLIRWRIKTGRGDTPDLSPAGTLSVITYIEALLIIAIVFVAVALARGLWYTPSGF